MPVPEDKPKQQQEDSRYRQDNDQGSQRLVRVNFIQIIDQWIEDGEQDE
jgi:hypothetical protein